MGSGPKGQSMGAFAPRVPIWYYCDPHEDEEDPLQPQDRMTAASKMDDPHHRLGTMTLPYIPPRAWRSAASRVTTRDRSSGEPKGRQPVQVRDPGLPLRRNSALAEEEHEDEDSGDDDDLIEEL